MIYCTKCGAEIADGANFCSKCGTKVESKPTPAPMSPPAPANEKDKKYWGGVIGIILLISGILTLATIDYDFSSIGHAVGYAVGTAIRVAIPVGGIALIIWLIKRKKK